MTHILDIARSEAEECEYVLQNCVVFPVAAFYVDDILTAFIIYAKLVDLKEKKGEQFCRKDLKDVQTYSGFEIWWDMNGKSLSLSQSRYVRALLNHFGLLN